MTDWRVQNKNDFFRLTTLTKNLNVRLFFSQPILYVQKGAYSVLATFEAYLYASRVSLIQEERTARKMIQ